MCVAREHDATCILVTAHTHAVAKTHVDDLPPAQPGRETFGTRSPRRLAPLSGPFNQAVGVHDLCLRPSSITPAPAPPPYPRTMSWEEKAAEVDQDAKRRHATAYRRTVFAQCRSGRGPAQQLGTGTSQSSYQPHGTSQSSLQSHSWDARHALSQDTPSVRAECRLPQTLGAEAASPAPKRQTDAKASRPTTAVSEASAVGLRHTSTLSLSTPTTDGAWTSLSDVSHDGVTTHIETTHIEKHVSLGSHGLPHQTHGQHYKHKHLNGPNEQHRKQRDMAGGGGCRRGTRLCDSVESSERLLEPEGGQLLAHNTFSLVPRPGPQGDLAKRSPFASNPAPLSSFPPARSSLPHPHSRPHPLPRKKCAVSIPSALARPASISSSPTGREPRARDLMLCSTSKDGPREKEAAKQAAHARALRRKR